MANLLKLFATKAVEAYLYPIKLQPRLALWAKYRILPFSEHLHATIDFIKKNRMNKCYGNGAIVDVGSYNGDTCLTFSKHFPGLKIFGFEPNPTIYREAEKSCRNNANISIQNCAIGATSGSILLHISSNGVSSSVHSFEDEKQFQHTETISVPIRTLDSQMKGEKVLLLKLDVQGHELNALKGAVNLLKNTAFVLTEMSNHSTYQEGCNYHEVDEFLRINSFKLVNLTSAYSNTGLTEFDSLYRNEKL